MYLIIEKSYPVNNVIKEVETKEEAIKYISLHNCFFDGVLFYQVINGGIEKC